MMDYPEHERMEAVSETSQAIGEFLEWLNDEGLVVATWERYTDCTNASGPVMENGGRKWECRGGTMTGNPTSNKPDEKGSVCTRCGGSGLVERIEPRLAPSGERIQALLARYFDIDLAKIEAEKRAMIAALDALDRADPHTQGV